VSVERSWPASADAARTADENIRQTRALTRFAMKPAEAARRVRTIRDMLGRAPEDRVAELLVTLRLRRLARGSEKRRQ
jgi:hypothetical protein